MNRNKIQSTEKPGVAVCGESRKHGFEWECREVILGSTPNKERTEFKKLPRFWLDLDDTIATVEPCTVQV